MAKIKLNGKRIIRLCAYKIMYISVFSIPLVILIIKFDYEFKNHVINSILVLYCSFAFRRIFLLTIALFLSGSDFGGNNDSTYMNKKIIEYQAEFYEDYPAVTKYNNTILTISSAIFVMGVVYFIVSTTALAYQ